MEIIISAQAIPPRRADLRFDPPLRKFGVIQVILFAMNKINSIYPTEVQEEGHPKLKDTFDSFRNRLDASIKENITLKKQIIARQSTECLEQLKKIREQSNRHKKRV